MKEESYQVYLDMVRDYLKTTKKRLLTGNEEAIVVAHLKVVAETFCHRHYHEKRLGNDVEGNLYEGLGITQVLSIETAKKVSELHEDFPGATPESYETKRDRVTAVTALRQSHRDMMEFRLA